MIPKEIIIHCSDTKDYGTVSWEAIRRYHKEVNGWQDIGYHFGVELVGSAYRWMIGRPDTHMGAHCRGHNHDSLGVCFVGRFEELQPPEAQFDSGACLVASLCRRWGIDPETGVKAHRDYDPHKTCPGTKFDMDDFRARVQNYIKRWPEEPYP